MSLQYCGEPMFDIYIFETYKLIDQLEDLIIESEKLGFYSSDIIDEIFRIMHTIKGSSAMMLLDGITNLAHNVEDLFYFFREQKPENIDFTYTSDMVLRAIDYIKIELEKGKNGDDLDGDSSYMIKDIKNYLDTLKSPDNLGKGEEAQEKNNNHIQKFYIAPDKDALLLKKYNYKAVIRFQEGCEMECIRAFAVVNEIQYLTEEIYHIPEDISDNEDSIHAIKHQGFTIFFKTDVSYEEVHEILMKTAFLKELQLDCIRDESELNTSKSKKNKVNKEGDAITHKNLISVNVEKLDKLMDLIGELVISESMVTQNIDLKGLTLDNFEKSARQLRKISSELQDTVMSIRMIPLTTTFHKMNRIVRDMCKNLNKEVELEIIGDETEVDKSIVEHISDPLMHLIRNAIDHGIETNIERESSGKTQGAKVILEAKDSGSDVLIIVKDNGKGLNKEKILQRAREKSLLHKPEEEMTDKEIYNLIFLPGFSTKEDVTEFSGRGVGMDVVGKNIEAIGGTVMVNSVPSVGTTITLKIPLTLSIINGMNVKVGNCRYTIPTLSIKESFKPKTKDIIKELEGSEMIMVRGQCYPLLRLANIFKVKECFCEIEKGICIMVESDGKFVCLFADELLGEQQTVVKSLPYYIKKNWTIKGIAGCTLLGDGGISLILDVARLCSFE